MGRKKYYCEYCDKSFNDDYSTRIQHLSSFRHLELRVEHYNNFREPAVILKEESTKKPCMRHQNEGMCRFGLMCRYSHYKPEEIEHLRHIVEADNFEVLPKFSDWFNQQVKNKDSSHVQLSYSVENYGKNLPPSLLPFDVMEYLTKDSTFWGS